MRHVFIAVLLILSCNVPSAAQLGLGLSLVLDDESVEDGWYTVTLRYYASISSDEVLAQEQVSGRFRGGYCFLVAGRTIAVPLEFLRSPTAAVGYSLDGTAERLPRIAIPSQQFTRTAEHALLADGLSPSFTGLVTSINEVAGPITLLGADGINVQRDGSRIIFRSNARIVAYGTVQGDNATHVFTVRPGVQLSDRVRVTARLTNSTTHINVTTELNRNDGTITLIAAAPLLSSESITWEIVE